MVDSGFLVKNYIVVPSGALYLFIRRISASMRILFSKLLLILRKLGVIRYGVNSYKYTNAKDMPADALLDDIYDAKKDLITKEDLKQLSSLKKREKQ